MCSEVVCAFLHCWYSIFLASFGGGHPTNDHSLTLCYIVWPCGGLCTKLITDRCDWVLPGALHWYSLTHTHTLAEAPAIRQPFTMQYSRPGGSNLNIPIVVTGVPFPNITWRNGSTDAMLMNDTRTTIGGTGSLTLNDLTQYDRGNYSLVLSNLADTQTTNFSIFVQCECINIQV